MVDFHLGQDSGNGMVDFLMRAGQGQLSQMERLGVLAVGLPVFLLSPPILPHVVTLILKLYKLPGKVRSAYLSVNWRGHIFLTVHDSSLTNPKGFDEPKMLDVKYLQIGISPWSLLFTRYCYFPHIIARELSIWVEKKNGRLNMSVYFSEQEPDGDKKEDEISKDDDDRKYMQYVMSLLGLVNPNMLLDNVGETLEKHGGATQMAFNTVGGTIDTTENIIKLGLDTVGNSVKSWEDSVNDAGGLDKWVGQTAQHVTSEVTGVVGSVAEGVQSEGLVGAAKVVRTHATGVVSSVAQGGHDAFLQEQLHRKVMGCYEEPAPNYTYFWVERCVIEPPLPPAGPDADSSGSKRGKDKDKAGAAPAAIRVTVRGLFDDKVEKDDISKNFRLQASLVRLSHAAELRPHPQARRHTGLPYNEFSRRLTLVINHTMQRENKSIILKIAHAGAAEAVSKHEWLLPKPASQAIGGVANGLGDVATGFSQAVQTSWRGGGDHGGAAGVVIGEVADNVTKAVQGGWSHVSQMGNSAKRLVSGGALSDDTASDADSMKTRGRSTSPVAQRQGSWSFQSLSREASEEGFDSHAENKIAVDQVVTDTHRAVGAAVDTTKEAAAVVTKGTADLLGSVVQGTGDTLSQWTGANVFKSVGDGVGGGILGVGNFTHGILGGGGGDGAKDAAVKKKKEEEDKEKKQKDDKEKAEKQTGEKEAENGKEKEEASEQVEQKQKEETEKEQGGSEREEEGEKGKEEEVEKSRA